jgi:RNase P subunit RPR2
MLKNPIWKEVNHMAAKEGYCVKCKEKREIKDPQEITMKNGRPATQGLCPECGTKMFKIGKF